MRLTIQTKLIGLSAASMSAIVAFLTVYFPGQQIKALRGDLSAKAETYGHLLATQLRSAVAFDDRETAREVLDSVAGDRDVASIVLYGKRGVELYGRGARSAWVDRAKNGVAAARVFAVSERIAAVEPVISLEGPRGTLVIELSTLRLHEGQRRVTRTAAAIGGTALMFGMLAAWLIARSFARRLANIARVASAVAAGDMQQNPVEDRATDEIGTMATAFGAMLNQLKAEQARLKTLVGDLTRADAALVCANQELEARVALRTAELTNATETLKQEMVQRSRVELELRQAQKLESVGRLAAGVAHEINTPVQFVNDSVYFLRDVLTDLTRLVACYQEACRAAIGGAPVDTLAATIRAAEAADIEFVLENAPRALERAIEGLNRITVIVRSMKEFAHPDQREMTPVDLNQAIRATLTVATNEYKYVATIETDFGELPRVTCHAGEINQAVLNVIVNAAHAIADRVDGTSEKGLIEVRTRLEGNKVLIAISDTGGGIPVAIRERIFDPFFTTKEVGRGTGQGLAISRSVVVDKHGGELTFSTREGKGTTFFLRIPVGPIPEDQKVAA